MTGRQKGSKDRKPRRRPNERTKCPQCPPEHEGWLRTELRSKDRVSYCIEHLPPKVATPVYPKCPDCDTDFDYFNWNGSPEKATVHCYCGFSARALDYFDATHIKVQAAPVDVGGS